MFFEEKRFEIREILRQLCQWKGVEIIEDEECPDRIQILVQGTHGIRLRVVSNSCMAGRPMKNALVRSQ